MHWVALVIAIGIGAYTFLTLHYRKHGPAYRPFEDSQNRATVARLVQAGWHLIPAEVVRPAEAARAAELPSPAAMTAAARGGLPGELDYALMEKPILPDRILSVSAPGEIAAGGTVRIYFTCVNNNLKVQLGEVLLYRKNKHLFLLPRFERAPGGLLARWKETMAWISFPATGLSPGRYRATLVGAAASQSWELVVQ